MDSCNWGKGSRIMSDCSAPSFFGDIILQSNDLSGLMGELGADRVELLSGIRLSSLSMEGKTDCSCQVIRHYNS